MANCLGIYLDDNIVKYAKLSVDNNKMVKVEKYGIKFTNQDDKFVIRQIIDETSSQNIPVVINPKNDVYYNTQKRNYLCACKKSYERAAAGNPEKNFFRAA